MTQTEHCEKYGHYCRIAELLRENRQLAYGRKEGLDSLVDSHMEKHRAAYVSEGNAALTALLIAQGHAEGCAGRTGRKQCGVCRQEEASGLAGGFCRDCPRADCDCHLRDIPAAAKEFHAAVVELAGTATAMLNAYDISAHPNPVPRIGLLRAALAAPAIRGLA
jgi:hypothetical protein